MLTKTQVKIMEIFATNITEKYSIKQIAEILDKPYPLIHRSIHKLLDEKLLLKDYHKLISLNYLENHQDLSYIEYLRSKSFLDKNKNIGLLQEEIVKNFPYGYFSVIIFGSSVISKKPDDLDLLLIIENTEEIEKAEKYLYNITRNYSLKIHSLILSFESVYEMLIRREDKNVMNEVLSKHLVLYGAELFYRLIAKGRK